MVGKTSLSGWVRLGIVVSAPLCLMAGYIQYDGDDEIYEYYQYTPQKQKAVQTIVERETKAQEQSATKTPEGLPPAFIIMRTPAQIQANAFWDVVEREVDFARCSEPAKAEPALSSSYDISCPAYPDVGRLIMTTALPAGIIFGLGWIVGWVWRGFRSSKPENAD